MWQLIYAGLAGGRKGVPESVAEHPQVFATLTAPGLGAVHAAAMTAGRAAAGGGTRSMIPSWVAQSTRAYDYVAAVLWKWHAPALWDRFTVELVRVLAAAGRLSEAACRKLVRVAYAKVAEFQARGLVHFHAITRLDHPDDRANAPGLRVSADDLAAAICEAAKSTRCRVMPVAVRSSSCAWASSSTPASWPTLATASRCAPSRSRRMWRCTPARAPTSRSPVPAPHRSNHVRAGRLSSSKPGDVLAGVEASLRLSAKRSWSCASGHRTIGDEPARWCCGRRC